MIIKEELGASDRACVEQITENPYLQYLNDVDRGQQPPTNQGQLLLDATCAPADITYPTDLKLHNKAREKSEQIIDERHKARGKGHKKPRTYRQRARKQFLSVAKDKRVSRKKMRRCRRQQLGYLHRNLKSIDRLAQHTGLSLLGRGRYKDLLVITEVQRQQQWI
ncbi:hypothetical protein DSCA_37670 [Desulfosarcina alkanivorans]|uniref:Transposase InsH N-terminal domain-containing protein n=1 Tax=Desulfosarcina alkanivorans TaxID=571177 RepID=A0A5K7YZ02_9BACT|nr:hypothetical protein DSCA_37670 [Desulfosarcina alkanivorans]